MPRNHQVLVRLDEREYLDLLTAKAILGFDVINDSDAEVFREMLRVFKLALGEKFLEVQSELVKELEEYARYFRYGSVSVLLAEGVRRLRRWLNERASTQPATKTGAATD